MRRNPISEVGPMTIAFLILVGRALGLFRRLVTPVVALVLSRQPEVVYVQQVGRVCRRPRVLTDCSILREGFDAS